MENYYRDPTSFPSPTDVELFCSGLMNDPVSDTGIQPLPYEISQIGPTGYKTEQGFVSGSGPPLQIQGPTMGDMRFGEQGSALHQPNFMVGTNVTAAVTGPPDPVSDTGIQRLPYENPQIGPTGYNTEQGFGSGSGPPLHIQGQTVGEMRFVEQGSGLPQPNNMVGPDFTAAVTGPPVPGHDNGIQGFEGRSMFQIESTRHNTEQGFGSGVPQANNMFETEATAAVPGRPGQKIKRKINPAERSRKFRVKKKKEVDEMKENMQWLQEKNKRLRKKIKKLKKNLLESSRKLDDQLEKMQRLKKSLAKYRMANNKLSQTLENLSYICMAKNEA